MIRLGLYIFSALVVSGIFQQREPENTFSLKNTDYFTIDQFRNIYQVRFDQLKKLDKDGQTVFEYSNPLLGSIHSLSALDPLKLLLFYKDQAQITTLDNRLNESTAIKLIDMGLNDVQLVSQSDQDNVWVYDQATDRLYRINLNNASLSNKSLNITQLTGLENKPLQLESTYERVFLNVPEKGILVFDATGSLLQTVATKGVEHFAVSNENLYYLKNDTIQALNLKKNLMLKPKWKADKGASFTIAAGRLYILDQGKLSVFSLNS